MIASSANVNGSVCALSIHQRIGLTKSSSTLAQCSRRAAIQAASPTSATFSDANA